MVDRINEFSYQGGYGKVSVNQGMREVRTADSTAYGSPINLGTIKPLHMGRQILYCQISTAAAIAQGRLVQGPALVANHCGVPVASANAIGAKSVLICAGATAITKDQYKDGLLFIQSGAGSGYSYVISHHSSAAAGSGTTIYLKDEVEVALTSASICSLIPFQFKDVVVVPAGSATGCILGVTLMSAAAGSFVWLGKKGIWPAYVESAALNPGVAVTYGCAAGTVMAMAESGEATARLRGIIGIAVNSAAAANSYGLVNFNL